MNVLKFALFVLLGGWVVNTYGQEVFVQLERLSQIRGCHALDFSVESFHQE